MKARVIVPKKVEIILAYQKRTQNKQNKAESNKTNLKNSLIKLVPQTEWLRIIFRTDASKLHFEMSSR